MSTVVEDKGLHQVHQLKLLDRVEYFGGVTVEA